MSYKPAFRRSTRRRRSLTLRERLLHLPYVENLVNRVIMQVVILGSSFSRLILAPMASIMTVLVIAIAIALPVSFHVLLKNIREAGGNLKAGYQVSVFLKPDVSNDSGRKLAEKLRQHHLITDTRFVTKEEGLKELQSYSGFGEALQALNFNPLPGVIGLTPADSVSTVDALEQLTYTLGKMPEVDFVQLDTQWVHKLAAILAAAQRGIWGFSLLLSMGVVFTVGNTIRLELNNRQEELAVIQLLGATESFIRRPFVYTGFWYAILGGLCAWLLVNMLILFLKGPVQHLAELYGSPFSLSFLTFGETVFMVGISVLLGVSAAYAVVSYHLHKMDPNRIG